MLEEEITYPESQSQYWKPIFTLYPLTLLSITIMAHKIRYHLPVHIRKFTFNSKPQEPAYQVTLEGS